MSEETHRQAEHLLLKAAVEQLTPAEESWLGRHVAECADCARVAGRLDEVVRSLRSAPAAFDPALVEVTRRRVRERARQLAPRRASLGLIWASCALTWVWVALSAPYIWKGCAWVGRVLGVPNWAWQMSFGLWWMLPALAVAAALIVHSAGRATPEDGYAESY